MRGRGELMRQTVAMTDMDALMRGTEDDVALVMTRAMEDGTEALKQDWRAQIAAAGLGTKLANTVRGRTFPVGRSSLDPATWVYTNAPKLIDTFDQGPTIRPTDGRRYLAIPTNKVPRKGRKRMTPLDVEVAFNQDLIVVPGKRGSRLAFVDVVASRNRKGIRPATRRRVAQGRVRKLVLMFVLVPVVKVRKRLDLDALTVRAQARYSALLAARWAGIPDGTAPMGTRR